jgi:hypothetical protein
MYMRQTSDVERVDSCLNSGYAVRAACATLLQQRLREGQVARHIPARWVVVRECSSFRVLSSAPVRREGMLTTR